MINPLFKFPGGKRRLAPFIDTFRPEGWAVAEPFAGAAAYALYAVQHGAPRATISDADPRVVLIHQALEHPSFPRVWEHRDPIPHDKEGYLALRARVNRILGQQITLFAPPSVGVLLIQLSRTAYSGLWRTNRRGEFNAPAGVFPAYEPPQADVEAVSKLYRGGVCTQAAGDFADFTFRATDAPVFVYCDPPYLGTPFTGYGNGRRFTQEDHARLARWAEELATRGNVVAVSNQCDTGAQRALYPAAAGWRIHETRTRRSIGAGTGGAAHVGEFLAVLGGAL